MFSFVKNRFTFYAVALGLMAFSLISPWIFGVNLGIDMTGGIQIEYATE
jgi:preprotein translocase subunit SecF